MSTDRIEVAKNGYTPLVVLLVHISEDALHHVLRLPIRMLDSLSHNKTITIHVLWVCSHRKDREHHHKQYRRTRKLVITSLQHTTQRLHTMLSHHFQQINRTNKVILIVLKRFALRLTNMLESSKMDYSIERTVFCKYLIQTSFVKERALHLIPTHYTHLHKLQLALCWPCYFLYCFKTAQSTN